MPTAFLKHEALFTRAFTQAIISWNNAEWAAQRILSGFVHGSIGSSVVLQHLKSVALQDALTAIADLLTDPQTPSSTEVAEHVLHFVEGFDRLRVYRNFYVHSVKGLIRSEANPDECVGMIYETEAKKKLAWINHRLTYDELISFLANVRELGGYGDQLALYLTPSKSLAALFRPKQPLSSLEKPIWPETLKKTRTYPSKLPPPQEPSQA